MCIRDRICPGDGMFELDPRVLIDKAFEVLAESTQDCDKKEIRAICVTSFGESFVCFDENDQILANTMIYMDHRGTKEGEEFTELFSEKEIFSKTGNYVDPMFAIYKLRWLHKNRPEMMAKVKRISFITDFITYMPVSYTHLDVYKRQIQDKITELCPEAVIVARQAGDNPEKGMQITEDVMQQHPEVNVITGNNLSLIHI